jgi:hypothetical protein
LVIDLLGAHFWHALQDTQQDPTRSKALRSNGTIERYSWNPQLELGQYTRGHSNSQ